MRKLLCTLALALTLPLSLSAAKPAPIVAGKQYKIMPASVQSDITNPKGKVEVTEFFSYGCPFCFKLEPTLEKWLKSKPKNVDFARVPVVFHPQWLILAKAYYTADALGVAPKLSPIIFKAIHVQNRDLGNQKALAEIFEKNGVSKKDFESAFNFSPGIDSQLLRGKKLMADYKVFQVPTIVIGGKYKTDPTMAGGFDNIPRVINFLIKKVKDGK